MARISEIHYKDNLASQTSEFVEIALSPSEDESAFVVSYYEADGTETVQVALTDAAIEKTYDADAREWVYVLDSDVVGRRLTAPDMGTQSEAVALVDISGPANVVLQFYSIESGTENITAVDGAAAGASSTTLAKAADESLQWNKPDPDTVVSAPLSRGDSGIAICFASGTLIATPAGPVSVEELRPGDRVTTLDRGAQPIRWAGRRALTTAQLAANPKLRPIRIRAGALGPGVPARDLTVSPQHRILVVVEGREVLIPAKKLLPLRGVRIAWGVSSVVYHHLAFDLHEILIANGAPAESLYPGPMALRAVGPAAAAELIALFPGAALPGGAPRPARPLAKALP